MFELIPLYFTRSDFQFNKSTLIEKSSTQPFSTVKTSTLSPKPALLSKAKGKKSSSKTPKTSKTLEIAENPKKLNKTSNIFLASRHISTRKVYDLYLHIEKKKILERLPESDKRPMLRTSLKSYSPFKTANTKKLTPEIETPEIRPSQMTSYESWKRSQNYLPGQKMFCIVGTYPDVRRALLQRGWIENRDSDSAHYDLKWTRNARVPGTIQEWQLFNHFPRNYELSVKWQLYENIKQGRKNMSFLSMIPRCFRFDAKGIEEFFECFKVVFAASVVKKFIKNDLKVLQEHAIVALNICKRWVAELENKSNEEKFSGLALGIEWKILNCFNSNEVKGLFQRSLLTYHVDLLSGCKNALKKLEELDPQFRINGKKNIWIVKAGRKSRGRDICLFDDLESLKTYTASPNSWVVQKYIENPMIVQDRKFDIRQWVLVSSSDPLTIWVYKKCYLRFSLEPYSSKDLKNRFVHLTNNSISKKSKHFQASSIEGCMWSIDEFKSYLGSISQPDSWSQKIYPTMKQIIKSSLLSISTLGRKASFELFGYDFLLDEHLNPWLLEVNSSPAMDYSTVITT